MSQAQRDEFFRQYTALVEAAGKLYFAGVWVLQGDGLPPEEQSQRWEALRDALGLKPETGQAKTGV